MENVSTSFIGVPELSVTVTVAEVPFVLFRITACKQVVEENTAVEEVGTAARACDATVLPHAVFGMLLTVPMTFVPAGIAGSAVTAVVEPESFIVWPITLEPAGSEGNEVTAVVDPLSAMTWPMTFVPAGSALPTVTVDPGPPDC